jgi:uncharacterized protein (DUF1697 family)
VGRAGADQERARRIRRVTGTLRHSGAVRTHLALLRGINVGGRNTLPMSDLRETVTSLGHRDVATYIQSGNVVFTPGADGTWADGAGTGCGAIADALEQAIADRSGIRPGVVVLTRDQLAAVVDGNPYRDESDPRRLHVEFHRERLGVPAVDAVATAVQRARDKGSRDEATAAGSVVYLRTPDGLGRSELAAQLARRPGAATGGVTTTRNWATVTRLLAMLDDA